MVNRTNLKELHERMLTECLDAPLSRHGFKRGKESIKYKRGDGKNWQYIEVQCRRPKYSDVPLLAYISPQFIFDFDETNRIYREMMKHDPPGLEPNRGTCEMHIGLLDDVKELPQWHPTNESEYIAAGHKIAAFIDKWVIPFADQYRTPKALLEGYLKNDPRCGTYVETASIMAAAAIELGEIETAKRIIQDRYGDPFYPGVKRRYQAAFDYLGMK